MRPACERPGKILICSEMRPPAASTRYRSGTCRRWAFSWMRMIFWTVFSPQDPALTVKSLAMTQTVRPPTLPTPVTTPSAGVSAS